MNANVQDLLNRFDGVGGDSRLAWYGQCRAAGMTHEEAVLDTYEHFIGWCRKFWPARGIEVPSE